MRAVRTLQCSELEPGPGDANSAAMWRTLTLALLTVLNAVAADLPLPPLVVGPPAAGRRVAVTPPEYAGTQVHHLVALPDDWTPDWSARGKRWPVIVEYTGNFHPASGSTGKIEGAALGYGLSRGEAIWVVLPYVAVDGRRNEVTWWGDTAATVRYAKTNVPRICAEFGGESTQVLLCGFSRGAIGVSFIGLHDDEVAQLWCGLWAHDHFDGAREWRGTEWGSPLARYQTEATARLRRLRGRPLLVTQGDTGSLTRDYLQPRLEPTQWTFRTIDMHALFGAFPNPSAKAPHTDRWLLRESADGDAVRQWWQALRGQDTRPAGKKSRAAGGV